MQQGTKIVQKHAVRKQSSLRHAPLRRMSSGNLCRAKHIDDMRQLRPTRLDFERCHLMRQENVRACVRPTNLAPCPSWTQQLCRFPAWPPTTYPR